MSEAHRSYFEVRRLWKLEDQFPCCHGMIIVTNGVLFNF